LRKIKFSLIFGNAIKVLHLGRLQTSSQISYLASMTWQE
jgi:hypothetical protein